MFRELSHPAAFVYEALEHAGGRPTRSFDLVGGTGLSRAAVYEALQTLAGWHLVESRGSRWVLVAGTSLRLLAERFGCVDTVRGLGAPAPRRPGPVPAGAENRRPAPCSGPESVGGVPLAAAGTAPGGGDRA